MCIHIKCNKIKIFISVYTRGLHRPKPDQQMRGDIFWPDQVGSKRNDFSAVPGQKKEHE